MSLSALHKRKHKRYWWHHRTHGKYLPQVYMAMSQQEQQILSQWFQETERKKFAGEMSIPMASVVTALISGSNITRVVQLGHWTGYSTLVIGFCLRGMQATQSLFSIDINQGSTDYTQKWIQSAELQNTVRLHVSDSISPQAVALAKEYLGGDPGMLVIDSSHQYRHTLLELDLWYDELQPGAIIAMHDSSDYGTTYDSTASGGVQRAVQEWSASHPDVSTISLTSNNTEQDAYMDGCGLTLIQKPNR